MLVDNAAVRVALTNQHADLGDIYFDLGLVAEAVEEFRKAGLKLDMGKSCIRFKSLGDLPHSAVAGLASGMTVEEYIERYEALIALATAVIRSYCLEFDLAYGLVATKKSIRDLIRHRTAGNVRKTEDIELLMRAEDLHVAPVITCPADQTVNCQDRNDPAATGSATATPSTAAMKATSRMYGIHPTGMP